jgi:uncharacterized damage-inducible protein DinB
MRAHLVGFCLSTLIATSASGQTLLVPMHQDVAQAQRKVIALAQAIPESAYSWRPPGARSIGEVLMHIAADNYYLVIPLGKAAPAETKITEDFKTTAEYEKRQIPKAQIIAELEASFTHLHQGMDLTTDANLNETVKFFGQDRSRQRVMLATVSHLHEHLGQLIAYARSNNVTPPWSGGQ